MKEKALKDEMQKKLLREKRKATRSNSPAESRKKVRNRKKRLLD